MAADGRGGLGIPGSAAQPCVDAGWLAARAAADASARAATLGRLLPELINYLIETADPAGVLEIIDLGAGTGANQRWLAPRLPFKQRWIHLDHDPVISRWLPLSADTMIIDAGVETLGQVLAGRSTDQRLVTCSALLDVLAMDQLDAVCRAVIDNQVPTLFSLTVTGTLSLTPADARDQLLEDAFNDHQRRGGRVGPDAATLAANALCAGGFTVRTQETTWQLSASSESAFIRQLLQERLDAVVAQDSTLAAISAAWLELRRSQLALGILRIEVGHLDILALPGGSLPSHREVEDGADVAAEAEPAYRTGEGIREQIGAGESNAGNAIPNQDRSHGQIKPVEQARGQEI
jgi:hypothetical protein